MVDFFLSFTVFNYSFHVCSSFFISAVAFAYQSWPAVLNALFFFSILQNNSFSPFCHGNSLHTVYLKCILVYMSRIPNLTFKLSVILIMLSYLTNHEMVKSHYIKHYNKPCTALCVMWHIMGV